MGDKYDEETGVIDYQSLSPELRERTDALIVHSLRLSEYTEVNDNELRRQSVYDRVSEALETVSGGEGAPTPMDSAEALFGSNETKESGGDHSEPDREY